jgi:F-type H+-transporting ATPase subunit b
MTIDFWGLGLQAVNVLILVWLLSRVFWRPVAKAIETREAAAKTLIGDAETTKAKVDAALAEVAETRAGLEAERQTLLAEAAAKAETAAKATLAEALEKAEQITDAARLANAREIDAARAENAAKSAQLAVDIARKLLTRLDTASIQAAFLDLLVQAIEHLPANDRAALVGTAADIDLVSASDLADADKAKIATAIRDAIGGEPKLTFVTDPDLIAGFEIRTAHFVLHDSWRSDLSEILGGLKDAA